jgi:two-component system chemotaxis response regulator CheY
MSKIAITVDDSKTMREMVSFTLTNNGFSVLQAEDGKHAIEVLGGKKVDLIITDLNMPNMDGITFIRKLREDPTYKYVPILMLTTESEDTKKNEGKAAGATGWLVKPFSPEKLVQIIKKVCP